MRILFVCTGNICRSPFAAALGPSIDPQHTYTSAGTTALEGEPASRSGITAAHQHYEVGMGGHRATQLTSDMVENADIVYAMEQTHADEASRLDPSARVELLSPDGGPIPDPYGGDETAYLVSYSLIRRALVLRLQPDVKSP